MVIYTPTLVSELSNLGYKVYAEPLGTSREVPCITYAEVTNIDNKVGDNLSYSDLAYQIKIWGKSIKEVYSIAVIVDAKMKRLGFRRTFTLDGEEEGKNYKIIRYNAIAYERR